MIGKPYEPLMEESRPLAPEQADAVAEQRVALDARPDVAWLEEGPARGRATAHLRAGLPRDHRRDRVRRRGGRGRAGRGGRVMDLASQIFAYEEGGLDPFETVLLFQDLVNRGTAWQLQGHYGREAVRLMDCGLVTPAEVSDPEPEEVADLLDLMDEGWGWSA
jgi:hypothetical protein